MSKVNTVNSVVNINAANLKDDKVSAIANSLNVSIEKAESLVKRYEKQQQYRKEYQKKRYQQMKLVASLLRVK